MTQKKRSMELGKAYCELRGKTLGRSTIMQGVGRSLGLPSDFDMRLNTLTRLVRPTTPHTYRTPHVPPPPRAACAHMLRVRSHTEHRRDRDLRRL